MSIANGMTLDEYMKATRKRLAKPVVPRGKKTARILKASEYNYAQEPGRIHVVFPIRAVPERNEHRHWGRHAKRAKEQRGLVRLMWPRHAAVPVPPLVVTLTRIAPRLLDDGDNISSSLAACRDEISCQLGMFQYDSKRRRIALDGPGSGIEWKYAQERGEYAVRVVVEIAND